MIKPWNLKQAVLSWKKRKLNRRVLLVGFLLALLCLQANVEMLSKIARYCSMFLSRLHDLTL
jgi:hypothetical protein